MENIMTIMAIIKTGKERKAEKKESITRANIIETDHGGMGIEFEIMITRIVIDEEKTNMIGIIT